MNSNQAQWIDPNSATEEELTQIPGIGQALARRIAAGRPYSNIDDLMRVSGIGPVFLEHIRPYLEMGQAALKLQEDAEPEPEAEPEPSELVGTKIASTLLEEDEAQELAPATAPDIPEPAPVIAETPAEEIAELAPPAAQAEDSAPPSPDQKLEETGADHAPAPSETQAPARPAPAPAPKPPAASSDLTYTQAMTASLISGLILMALAVLFSLGILASLNQGRLQFAAPAQVNQIQTQVNQLEAQINTLNQDMGSLRVRVDNLESLSGRLDAMQQDLQEVQTSLDQALTNIDNLNQQVEALSTEVETLRTQTQRFSSFLEGLRDLVSGVLTPEEGTP